jgi:hypothetical protein
MSVCCATLGLGLRVAFTAEDGLTVGKLFGAYVGTLSSSHGAVELSADMRFVGPWVGS